MNQLKISLFGKFCAQCEQQTIDGFDALKVQELFCYLLLYRQQAHHREKLAALLWCDNTTHQSKRYLSKVLWQLQTAFENYHIPTDLFLIEPDWIRLNHEADFWLDVGIFEQAYKLIRSPAKSKLSLETAQFLQEVVPLYKGDLLEGWYQDWCIFERERFQYMYLGILDSLIRYSESQKAYKQAINYATEILRHDYAREHTHRRLMRLYYLTGNRTEALRQYDRCAEALTKELAVQPADSTIALYHKIRADCLGKSSAELTAPDHTPPAATPTLEKTLTQLKHLQMTLTHLQEQTQQEIEKVESVINGSD
ncbi:MAG: hypothetical protein H6658_11860 [Ardenticatenaceae bacterium]|nr:hypothetical protein [Ardenticatenaceae bacterium]